MGDAIDANTGGKAVDDTLICYGDAVKALGDGRVGGYLVLFGTPEQTDITREYFTPDTDFGLDLTDRTRVYYNHTLDKTLTTRSLGVGTLKADHAGVWIEAQLALRDEYERKLYEAVESGKMGWSSGTLSHIARYEPQPNGARKIAYWPLGLDASITPTPCEPRTRATTLKALKLMAEGDDESGGSTAPEDGGEDKKPNPFKAGDAVKWAAYGNHKKGHGSVVSLHTHGNVPGTENDLEATEDEPAAKVHLRERKPEGGYKDTGRHVAHPVKRLRPDRGAVKGAILGDTDEAVTLAGLCRLNDLFLNCLYRFVGTDAYTSADIVSNIAAAFEEYKDAAVGIIEAMLGGETPGDEALEEAKSLVTQAGVRLNAGLTFDDHSETVLTAVKGLTDRLDSLAALRASEGRGLSRVRLDSLDAVLTSLAALRDSAGRAAKAAAPSPSPVDVDRLRAAVLRHEAWHAGHR